MLRASSATGNPLTYAHRARIAELAMKPRLPTMHFSFRGRGRGAFSAAGRSGRTLARRGCARRRLVRVVAFG